MYPLKLRFIAKSALWGGSRLKEAYGKACDLSPLSETWELSCRAAEDCLIENGPAAGMTLGRYFEDYGARLVGRAYAEEDAATRRFPLLIKFIDACDKLSVQVHPDDAYAAAHERDPGKTELWYVVEAKPGARLIYGLADGVTSADFEAAVREGRIGDVVRYVPVEKGQTWFIPSGMLHAIGEGILIAEIQQNSDLTYRVYDYDRRGADGKTRPLHTEQAIAVTRPFSEEEVAAVRFDPAVCPLPYGEALAAGRYFRVSRLLLDGKQTVTVEEDSFLHLLCVEGEGEIVTDGDRYPITCGDSFFLPAGLGAVTLQGKATLLLSAV